MKKFLFIFVTAFISVEIFANESLDSLPCYCVDLVELMGGNNETELSEEDVKALEKDNIYFSERKDCLAKFLVPVKQGKKAAGPKEKPLPLFVGQKIGTWGYYSSRDSRAMGIASVAANCTTVQMARELYAAMQYNPELARPIINYIYESYYNEESRYFALKHIGFTVSEIDQMEEIGYAHYRVLKYANENPPLTREELIKEGFEAERAFDGYEYSEEELKKYYLDNRDAAARNRDMVASEKEINDDPYYRGRLKLKTWKIKDEWSEEFRSCQVADIKPCNFPIIVHIDKNGKGRLECTEDAPALAKYFCDYASKNGSPYFHPVRLEFRKIKESTNVNVKSAINVIEQRIFEETAEVKIAYKGGQWELVKSPDNWDKIPLQNYIRSLQLENKTKKSKLTLTVQIIKRKMGVGYLGSCKLAPIYLITSSSDKNLQFVVYENSRVRW